MTKQQTITEQQRRAFWRAFSTACRTLNLSDKEARETYRHDVLREAGGVDHLADLGRTSGYDRVMARLWQDAGDYEAAGRYIVASASRMQALCLDCAEQIIDLTGSGADALSYLRGILRQSRLATVTDDWALDVPESSARRVFLMLDTHRVRLLRRAGYVGPTGYRYGTSWLPCVVPPPAHVSLPAGRRHRTPRLRLA